MTDDDRDPEAVLQSSKEQRRDQTEPSSEPEVAKPAEMLDDAVTTAYEQLHDGDLTENLTVRDGDLAVLFAALETTDRLSDVSRDAMMALGRNDDDANHEARATALRYLIRLGLDEVDTDLLEELQEGKKAHLVEHADDF